MPRRAPSQNDRVLAVLRARGDAGVTPVDFLPPVVDGGDPIIRLAARVDVLRNRGFRIPNLSAGNELAHYVLRASGDPATTTPPRTRAQTTNQGALPS